MLAVDIQAVFARKIGPLSFEADPLIEAGLWIVSGRSHVPLADKCGLVAGLLQKLREESGSRRNRRIVVDDLVPMRVDARQDTGAAWGTKRRGDEGILQMSAFPGKRIQLRRAQPGLSVHEPHRVVAMIVGQDEDDVARLGTRGLAAALPVPSEFALRAAAAADRNKLRLDCSLPSQIADRSRYINNAASKEYTLS